MNRKDHILRTSDGKEPRVWLSDYPAVDIAVTTFNVAKYVEDCIKSIVEQTYPFRHIYFVDDCSKDTTVEKIKNLVKKYEIKEKCSFFQTEKNSGYGTTLKWAIEAGNNELVAIVDSDDFLDDKNALQIIVDAHRERPNVSMIYTDYYEITTRGYQQKSLIKAKPPTEQFLGGFTNNVYNGTDADISHLKTFKREFYNMTVGLNHRLLKAVDKDVILKLEEVGKLFYLRKPLYCYRKHSASISTVWRDRSVEYKNKVLKLKGDMYLSAKHRRERGILMKVGNTYTYYENGKKLGLNCKREDVEECTL
jgi:glycosyltransferase involved in cell wall biosynthesis